MRYLARLDLISKLGCSTIFMNDEEEDILANRKISQVEYDKLLEIAQQLGLAEIPIFQIYRSKLIVK